MREILTQMSPIVLDELQTAGGRQTPEFEVTITAACNEIMRSETKNDFLKSGSKLDEYLI